MTGNRFAVCFTGLLLAVAPVLHAQTNPPAPHQQLQIHSTGPQGGQQPVAGMAIGGPAGVLTDEQRASYQAAMKEARGKLAELDAKLRAAHQDVVTASVMGKFDESLIRQKALAAAQIEAEMVVIRAKAFSQVQPPLTPDQIEKIKTGQSGPPRPLTRPLDRPLHRDVPAGTNHDANGLPPKP